MRILSLVVLAALAYYSQESCAVRSDTATAVAYTLVQPRVIPQPRVTPDPQEDLGMPAMPPQPEDKTELPPVPVQSPLAKPTVQPSCDTGVCAPRPTVVPVRRFGGRIFRR